ncbi:MAG: AbrB/MazE/SpoVT family DNA-binding domain-containing protein [Planctomycetota bacterium]|jgi:AbrB family looped-hinge helix DNA binding protein
MTDMERKSMPSAKVTSKGQVTIPKEIRHALRLDAGDRVAFRLRSDGIVEMLPETIDLLSLFGAMTPARRGVTIEDMKDAVRQRASTR